ncbi:MAG: alpha/beta hydrolase [Oculatellaceae cyanobacterium bins.114]|nr:alpha/beta hydrolase [Oculatellaceae cyanobacterium bins.114]
MSQAIEAIAYHGWGFDQDCWALWQAQFAEHAISLQTFDRGYFGAAHTPTFTDNFRKIVMVHSYGLHLCSLEHLAQADILVIFASFLHFHPQENRNQRRSQRVLQQMILECQRHPQTVLAQFYTQCGLPLEDTLRQHSSFNRERLVSDLQGLNTTHLDVQALKTIPTIVIFHGITDQIVSLNKGRELLELLPDRTHFFPIDNAGHALPFTHLHECWKILYERYL